MIGLLGFDDNNLRYYIGYADSSVHYITSGHRIKVYYKELILESFIEHNSMDYYMTAYPGIGLKSLIDSQAETTISEVIWQCDKITIEEKGGDHV